MVIETALIPVAGEGKRMKPYSNTTSKELLDVAGKPVINYIIDEAIRSGAKNLIFVISEKKYELNQHLSSIRYDDVEINFVIQKKDMQGFGGAILSAEHLIDSPFMLLTGDSIFLDKGMTMLSIMSKKYEWCKRCIVGLSKKTKEEAYKYGVVRGKMYTKQMLEIVEMIEKPREITDSEAIIMNGRYILDQRFFENIPEPKEKNNEIQITDILQNMTVCGMLSDDIWLDTGYIEGWKYAQKTISGLNEMV